MKLKKNGVVHKFAYGGLMGADEKPVQTNRCNLFWLCVLQLFLGYPITTVIWTIHTGISYTVCLLFAGYLRWEKFGTPGKKFFFYEKWPRLWGRRIYPVWILLFALASYYWHVLYGYSSRAFQFVTYDLPRRPETWITVAIFALALAIAYTVRHQREIEEMEILKLVYGYFHDLKNKLCTTVEFVDKDDLGEQE